MSLLTLREILNCHGTGPVVETQNEQWQRIAKTQLAKILSELEALLEPQVIEGVATWPTQSKIYAWIESAKREIGECSES